MFVSSVTDRGAAPALVATLSYTQQRHRMIAENVANWGNPNYKTKRLDARTFQSALGRALKERGSFKNAFRIEATEQFHMNQSGGLSVTPVDRPSGNILFHDGTNMSVEKEMADLAENAMMHEVATTMLRGRYEGLRKAIRGRS